MAIIYDNVCQPAPQVNNWSILLSSSTACMPLLMAISTLVLRHALVLFGGVTYTLSVPFP